MSLCERRARSVSSARRRVKLGCGLMLGGLLACAHAPPVESAHDALRARRLYERGVALSAQGDLTRAEQYLALAHHEAGRDRKSLAALLAVCVRASRLRSALAYAEPYVHDHPRELPLLQLMAALQLALGELAPARVTLEQALRVDGTRPETHYLLARVYAASKPDGARASQHRKRARTHYARYLALAPAGPHAEEARTMLAPGQRAE